MGNANSDGPLTGEAESADGLRLRPLQAATGHGFSVTHAYFEVVYGPLLGPTAVLLGRALVRHLEAKGGPVTVRALDVAQEVGIRAGRTDVLGKRSHLVRAIDRLAHHRVVVPLDDRVLGVHLVVPPLGSSALAKLPPTARQAHAQFLTELTEG